MKRAITILLAAIAVISGCKKSHDTYTVIISLDGNRWDYPEMYDMPFFDSLARVGVSAITSISPVFIFLLI